MFSVISGGSRSRKRERTLKARGMERMGEVKFGGSEGKWEQPPARRSARESTAAPSGNSAVASRSCQAMGAWQARTGSAPHVHVGQVPRGWFGWGTSLRRCRLWPPADLAVGETVGTMLPGVLSTDTQIPYARSRRGGPRRPPPTHTWLAKRFHRPPKPRLQPRPCPAHRADIPRGCAPGTALG